MTSGTSSPIAQDALLHLSGVIEIQICMRLETADESAVITAPVVQLAPENAALIAAFLRSVATDPHNSAQTRATAVANRPEEILARALTLAQLATA